MPNVHQLIVADLKKQANPKKARLLQRFFKTGKGEYGEGDIFWGIMVPVQRKVVKKYFKEASLNDIQKLLSSKIHEQRLVAVLMLVEKYKSTACHSRESGNPGIVACHKTNFLDPRRNLPRTMIRGEDDIKNNKRKQIFDFYLKNTKYINNWDLVDLSAPNIVGQYLLSRRDMPLACLYKMIHSKNLWERRIAVLATAAFIRQNDFTDTIKIAKILLNDQHDLIHKAVGWMLREIGKREQKILLNFLDQHVKKMPRTMLRYAIEKLPLVKRKHYLTIH